MMDFQTICLCMIVKNEAQVIRRCLDSVRPIITHWVIVDTGSTDGTQQIIREHLRDLPGELYERPWKDFAHNRSEALELARPLADYSLIIDADDALEIPPGFKLGPLTADCYTMDIRDDPQVYPRIQLASNRLKWVYRGVLHEFITADQPYSTSHLEIGMRRNHDGARRKDPKWFRQDAAVLERALGKEQDPFLRSRYTFYLAQSYRDGGEPEKALRCYLDRAGLGGWQEEVYYSLYQAAKLKQQLEHPDEEVIAAYDAATNALPARVEADHWASRHCRVKGLHQQGYEIARRSLGKAFPQGCLFGEPWVYETGLLDEFAVNAYWSGHHEECLDACLKILATGRVAAHDLQRIVGNARYAWEEIERRTRGAAVVSRQQAVPKAPIPRAIGANRRIAVITPYYKEETAVLWQCHQSVVSQSVDVTHFMIADGFPNKEVDGWNARHVLLPTAHADNGNTPRGIGSVLAEVEGYDFIAYLDADNWFHPDHLTSLMEIHEKTGADVCCTMRSFHQMDGTEMPGVREVDEEQCTHVDTSCYLLHRGAFGVLRVWTSMPRPLSPVCDRVFLAAIREQRLPMAFTKRPTVAFRSQYACHYVAAGLPAPEGAKHDIGVAERDWLSSPEGVQETVRALGFYPLL
jgi:glycosyltransferase involved in cell wall biosynthesis